MFSFLIENYTKLGSERRNLEESEYNKLSFPEGI